MPAADPPNLRWGFDAAGAPVDLLRAFADPRRRQILETLAAGPTDISALARRCGLPRQTVMHHLGILQRVGLVQQRHHVALVLPKGLAPLRRYFDIALTAAAISAS
jgi:DNA-binding transcriptional ArsR family regulator